MVLNTEMNVQLYTAGNNIGVFIDNLDDTRGILKGRVGAL